MATIKFDEEDKQEGAAQSETAPALSKSVAPVSQPTGQSAATPNTKPTSSGSFQDVGKYVQARTPEQLRQSAERVAGHLGSKFEEQANKLREESKNYASGIKRVQDVTAGQTLDTIDPNALGQQFHGRYEAVQPFQSQATGRLEELRRQAEDTQTSTGKVNALRGLIQDRGLRRLTGGGAALSGVLLQRPEQSRQAFGNLRQDVNTIGSSAQQAAQQAIAQAQQNRQQSIQEAQNLARQWWATQRGQLQSQADANQAAVRESQKKQIVDAAAREWASTPSGNFRDILAGYERRNQVQGGVDAATRARIDALNAIAAQQGLSGITPIEVAQPLTVEERYVPRDMTPPATQETPSAWEQMTEQERLDSATAPMDPEARKRITMRNEAAAGIPEHLRTYRADGTRNPYRP